MGRDEGIGPPSHALQFRHAGKTRTDLRHSACDGPRAATIRCIDREQRRLELVVGRTGVLPQEQRPLEVDARRLEILDLVIDPAAVLVRERRDRTPVRGRFVVRQLLRGALNFRASRARHARDAGWIWQIATIHVT